MLPLFLFLGAAFAIALWSCVHAMRPPADLDPAFQQVFDTELLLARARAQSLNRTEDRAA